MIQRFKFVHELTRIFTNVFRVNSCNSWIKKQKYAETSTSQRISEDIFGKMIIPFQKNFVHRQR
jgi:hypothetical protein